jgi:cell division protein FtsA
MSRQALAAVIEPRIEELFSLVQQSLRESGYEELLSSGIVLTGGSATMPGMIELGEEMFSMPVRVGSPKYEGSLADVVKSPRHSTAIGLLYEGMTQRAHQGRIMQKTGSLKNLAGRMKTWFQGNF